MSTEVAGRADFSAIRYAQCWEDADVLLAGLAIRPGDTCVGIASAGDNCLAMLTADPAKVIAVDLNPAQLACLELRVAAYRALDHAGLLRLIGSRPGADRSELYQRCRPLLREDARRFWDAHSPEIEAGIGSAGKFERYFAAFRNRILPLVHRRALVEDLLRRRDALAREDFYSECWNTWRWRLMFKIFFSRFVMGKKGRDPAFFKYVQGSVAERILGRARHALTKLDPADNPYLQWILCGEHREALPLALRPEHFETIRARLDRLEWRLGTVEDALTTLGDRSVDRFNLSDIFEYMGEEAYREALSRMVRAGRPGGRLLYWNMLVPRHRPPELADRLVAHDALGADLLAADKAFFYSAVVVEELR
jgi:S-adenosylmethionine-diacylglycerol 3-amino-3-carboxypropyl transferase